MKRLTAMLVAAVMVLSFSGILLAEMPCPQAGKPGMQGGMHPGGPEGMHDGGPDGMHMGALKASMFAKELGLSESQIKKLDEIKTKHKRKKLEIRHKIETAKLDLEEELKKSTPSMAVINNAIDTISDAQKEQLKMRIDGILETKKILSKEQFEKLETLMKEKRSMGIKKDGKGKKRWFK